MKYYYKAIAANTIVVKKSKRTVPFADAGGGAGILATEDEEFLSELDGRIERRVGGVSSISKEKFEELKKKVTQLSKPQPKQQPVLEQLRVMAPPDQQPKQKAPAAVAAPVKNDDAVKQAPAQAPAEPEKPKAPDQAPTLRAPK